MVVFQSVAFLWARFLPQNSVLLWLLYQSLKASFVYEVLRLFVWHRFAALQLVYTA